MLPSTWDELTTHQLEILAKLVMRYNTRFDILVRAAFAFMGMRVYRPFVVAGDKPRGGFVVGKGFKRYFVTPLLVYFITDALEFIFNDNEVNPRRLLNPYPTLRLGFLRRQTFHGPVHGLANITLNEWIQIEVARSYFEATDNPQYLYTMAGIMWRPTSANHPEGDLRDANILDNLPLRERQLRRYLPPHKLKVIMWFYTGSLQYLTYKYAEVFSTGQGNGDKTHDSTLDSFMRLVNSMAKYDPTKIQQVRSLALYDALHNIKEIVIQQNQKENERKRV